MIVKGDTVRFGKTGLGWEVVEVWTDGSVTVKSTGNGATGRQIRKTVRAGSAQHAKMVKVAR